jgi:hypothetical protein
VSLGSGYTSNVRFRGDFTCSFEVRSWPTAALCASSHCRPTSAVDQRPLSSDPINYRYCHVACRSLTALVQLHPERSKMIGHKLIGRDAGLTQRTDPLQRSSQGGIAIGADEHD